MVEPRVALQNPELVPLLVVRQLIGLAEREAGENVFKLPMQKFEKYFKLAVRIVEGRKELEKNTLNVIGNGVRRQVEQAGKPDTIPKMVRFLAWTHKLNSPSNGGV